MGEPNRWFEDVNLSEDADDEINGRFIDALNCYVSTCDGCGDPCSHELMRIDPVTDLSYCPECVYRLPQEIFFRLPK